MLKRPHLREGWVSLLLLLALLLTMAWSYQAGELAEGLHILVPTVILGLLVGLALAKGRIPALVAHAIGLGSGALCCFLLVATILDPPQRITAGVFWHSLPVRAEMLYVRMAQFWRAVRQSGTSADPLPFVLQLVVAGWLLAFYGAWFLFRCHWVWGAVLPAGVLTFLGVYYAPPGLLIYFILYLLLALLLVVRTHLYRRECAWERCRVVYDRHVGWAFLRDGTAISCAILALVWLIPRPVPQVSIGDCWTRLQEPWQWVQDEWSRLYSTLSYRGQTTASHFGRSMLLGGAIHLGSTVVMEVQAEEPQYWRATVLDRYTGSGWIDTNHYTLDMAPQAPLTSWSAYRSRHVLVQTVTVLRPEGTLVLAAGEPLQAEMGTRARASRRPLGDALPDDGAFEVSCLYAPGLAAGGRYQVRSLVSDASEDGLRATPREYPAWVHERYLQLPETVPRRLRELAHRLIAEAPSTGYDQAVAIERYLRTLRYNQTIDSPPAGRDPVDWFLFDTQEGYCTYFASAMVLLCRSAGLPARLAQGYASGEPVPERNAFLVREADAHTWPEVFFPGYGWIAFEPTPSQPLIVRPTSLEKGGADVLTPGQVPGRADGERYPPELPLPPLVEDREPGLGASSHGRSWLTLLPWAALVLLLIGMFVVAGKWGRVWRRLRPAERLYLQLCGVARPLGVRRAQTQTPFEFANALAQALDVEERSVRAIVGLYVQECFGRRYPTMQELACAQAQWRRLRRRCLRRVWRSFFSQLVSPK